MRPVTGRPGSVTPMNPFPPLPEDTDELLELLGELSLKYPKAARQVAEMLLEEQQAALEADGKSDGE